ncbi:aerobic respiration control sensor protein ArcB [bacterium BMS3Abin04]|nr:aerobic respiration control sensor protein ArcB [bacterium BMS3Abin04]
MLKDQKTAPNYFSYLESILEKLQQSNSEEINLYSNDSVQLLKSEYSALWNNPAVGIRVIDTEGNILRMNKSFADLMGYEIEELENTNDEDLGLSIHRVENEKRIKKINKSTELFTETEKTFVTKDAKNINCNIYSTKLKRNNSDYDNILEIIIPQKSYSGSEPIVKYQKDFLHTLLNNIPNPVFFKNKNGIFLGCNKVFELLVNEKVDELFGKSEYDIFPNEIARQEVSTDKELFRTGKSLAYEAKFDFGNETFQNVLINKSVFYNQEGEISGVIGIVIDLTDRKEFEDTLLKSEKKLKDSNAAKDKFFSIISHNLRSPFTTLLGFSDMLVDDFDNFGDDEKKSFTMEIQKSARHAYSLLDNLLLWTKCQLGNLKIKEEFIELTFLIDEVFNNQSIYAKSKNIILENRIPEHINIFNDKSLLTKVFDYIVNNGIKFSNELGRVIIRSEIVNDKVKVTVEDSGIGMSETELSKLFKLEEQNIKYGTKREKGTGFGLIICKELLANLNGSIDIHSVKDIGTTVTVNLSKSA